MWHDLQLPLLNTHVTYTLPGYCSIADTCVQIQIEHIRDITHYTLHFTHYPVHVWHTPAPGVPVLTLFTHHVDNKH